MGNANLTKEELVNLMKVSYEIGLKAYKDIITILTSQHKKLTHIGSEKEKAIQDTIKTSFKILMENSNTSLFSAMIETLKFTKEKPFGDITCFKCSAEVEEPHEHCDFCENIFCKKHIVTGKTENNYCEECCNLEKEFGFEFDPDFMMKKWVQTVHKKELSTANHGCNVALTLPFVLKAGELINKVILDGVQLNFHDYFIDESKADRDVILFVNGNPKMGSEIKYLIQKSKIAKKD